MKTLNERFGISGSVIAAVDLIKGIGKYAGLTPIYVPGATGFIDTNYQGKVTAALNALREQDFVFVHVEAPDEASHSGDLNLKKKAIEDVDSQVLTPLLKGLQNFKKWRLLIMPDHATPVKIRTHTSEPVPFLMVDSEKWDPNGCDPPVAFTEGNASSSGMFVDDAVQMIEMLLNQQ
jgi:2,3-bisphosphoglycerate-independent phosphoglycerate mutase